VRSASRTDLYHGRRYIHDGNVREDSGPIDDLTSWYSTATSSPVPHRGFSTQAERTPTIEPLEAEQAQEVKREVAGVIRARHSSSMGQVLRAARDMGRTTGV